MNLLKITKRDNLNKKQELIIRVIAILLSIVCAGLILVIFGLDPIRVFKAIIDGSIGTDLRIMIVGGFWAFIPAIFKAKMGTNETIFTLMMNYIGIKFVTYLQYGPWMDPNANGFPRVAPFSENAILPSILGVHAGWIIAILCTVLIFSLMKYTKLGYEITVVGESFETARYAGMNINKIIIVAMMISGGLCGLVGMIQASAIEKTLVAGISGGYGFTAIITAWLARLNAVATLFVCLVFAMLIQGGAYIQLAMNVPSSVASVVQGTILFFVLGSEFFLQYKIGFTHKQGRRVEKEVA